MAEEKWDFLEVGSSSMCPVCGRRLPKTMSENPDGSDLNQKYCSQKCRGRKSILKNGDEEKIMQLLLSRPRAATICPSEVLPPELKSDKQRMEDVRCAARRLVHRGKIEILQKNRVVNPFDFKGPIRLRRK